jgi:predicted AAA+ superfamily ATPase
MEGFVIEQLLAHLPKANAYYWRTQAGAELELLLFLKGRRIGVEIKRADAPKMTPSMVSALEDLELHRLLPVRPDRGCHHTHDTSRSLHRACPDLQVP